MEWSTGRINRWWIVDTIAGRGGISRTIKNTLALLFTVRLLYLFWSYLFKFRFKSQLESTIHMYICKLLKCVKTHNITFVDLLNHASIFRVKRFKEGQSGWVNNAAVGGWVGGWLKRRRVLDPLSNCLLRISSLHPLISPSLYPSIHQTPTHQPPYTSL